MISNLKLNLILNNIESNTETNTCIRSLKWWSSTLWPWLQALTENQTPNKSLKMTKRKKILFLIDVNPAVTSSSCSRPENNYFRQIRLATLRVLQYFSGKHKCFGEDERYAPLWGFKFYDSSSGDQPDFRRHNFFDLKVEDFNAFEKELEAKSQTNIKPSGQRGKQERKITK